MRISIVITAYNVEQWIKQSVESALQQKHDDLEVIVVEDCSTDKTLDVLNSIEGEFTLIRNEENKGAGMSRRIGIEHAIGEYVLLLDGDDWLHPTFVSSLAKVAEETDADIISGGITIMDNEQTGAYRQTCYGAIEVTGSAQVTRFFGEQVVFMNNKLIRRSLYEIVPYCDWRFVEDTPTIAKILYYSKKSVYVNNPGYMYRQQPQSLCHQASPYKQSLFRALCALELLEFYADKDEVYQRMFSVALFKQHVDELKAMNLTTEQITEYQEQWNRVALGVFKYLKE